jgi:uncharacterized integral membrane protein
MKFILGVIFGGLVIVFMIQNVDTVELQFLTWTMQIPRAVMILVVFAVGILLGWVIKSVGNIKRRKQASREEEWRQA